MASLKTACVRKGKQNCMKKFEITFEGKAYDYLTRTTIQEYLQSFFPKAEVTVKTMPQKNTKENV